MLSTVTVTSGNSSATSLLSRSRAYGILNKRQLQSHSLAYFSQKFYTHIAANHYALLGGTVKLLVFLSHKIASVLNLSSQKFNFGTLSNVRLQLQSYAQICCFFVCASPLITCAIITSPTLVPCDFTWVDLMAVFEYLDSYQQYEQSSTVTTSRWRRGNRHDDVRLTKSGNARSERLLMMPTEQLTD